MEQLFGPNVPKSCAFVVNTIPHRFDFPFIAIPVMASVKQIGFGTSNSENDINALFLPGSDGAIEHSSITKQIGLDGVNIEWKTEGEFYIGPSTTFTTPNDVCPTVVGYNRIVGVDRIELFASSDAYQGFYPPIEGFVSTQAHVDSFDPISCERTILNGSMNYELAYSLDEAFEIGLKLLKRYPMRKGSFVKAFGINEIKGPCWVGCAVYVPGRRDQDSCMVKFFVSDSKDSLDADMLHHQLSVDAKNSRYSTKYVSVLEVKDEVFTVGFIIAAAHVVAFGYESAALIAGVSKEHEHSSTAKEVKRNDRLAKTSFNI
jgi:hypothetical protein